MEGGWDIHTHLLPVDITEKAQSGAYGMNPGDGFVEVHGFRLQLSAMGRPENLVKRIDQDGLDGAVAAAPPPLFRADLPAGERRGYVDWLNAGVLKASGADPRIRAMAYLPTDLPECALEVAASLTPDWAGVIIGTDIGAHSYADEAYHPLWALLCERRLPVLIHPSESRDRRLAPFYLSNLMGNPMETTLAAAQMIFGDVPTRYPDLKVILSHGGGALAQLIGRWQRGFDSNRPGIKPLGASPIDAVRWFYLDTIVHSEAVLELLLKTVGEDHLLLGSDWPFPMGTASAEDDLRHLPDRLKRKIRLENAGRVFQL